MNSRIAQYARPAAIITGIVSIIGFVALMLFFTIEAPQVSSETNGFHLWGFISDIGALAAMLPLIVVMLAMHQVEQTHAPTLSRVAVFVGVIGAMAVSILQALLIIKVLTFEQEVGPVVLAMAIVGVWLVLANHLARVQHIMPAGPAWLGIAVGVAQASYPFLFQALGGANFYASMGSDITLMAITAVIMLLSYIGFPVWAFWFARVWSSKAARAEVVYAG